MRLHLFNARRLAEDLAAGRVSPRQQAYYLAISFVAWLIPYYFAIAVLPASFASPFATALYWAEFAMLVLINMVGVFYCLRQCRVDPGRHFMVDFGCLYAPVTIVVLAATWGAFHAGAWLLLRFMSGGGDFDTASYLHARLHDVLRYLTIVGQVFLIYAVVGHYMRRAAELRA
jgi:hypothetical protein